jgi:hypothetical protein
MVNNKLASILLTKSIDMFRAFNALLSENYWWLVHRLFIETRNYEDGLIFVDFLLGLNDKYKCKLTLDKYTAFEARIIELKLILLDKADRWAAYIYLYESLLNDREKIYKHKPFATIDPCDKRIKLTSVLSLQHRRYQLIKKKLKREMQGWKTGNLKHHPQSELSDEQIAMCIEWVRNEFNIESSTIE